MNFMYCIARGCITGYIIELPITFSTWNMIYHNIHMLVHMGIVISVKQSLYVVYIWMFGKFFGISLFSGFYN